VDEFNFKKHQNFQKSWKMILRFTIYGVVMFVLLYLLMQKNEEIEQSEQVEINQIEIDTTNMIEE
jgi:hypothetical protein